MSQSRISMRKIREIVRLYEQSKLSQRQISKALGISRPVINDYIIKVKTSGLGYGDIENMPDDMLMDILQGNKKANNQKYDFLSSKFAHFTKELKRLGVFYGKSIYRKILMDTATLNSVIIFRYGRIFQK